jgi:carboxyl-terminal processing protease
MNLKIWKIALGGFLGLTLACGLFSAGLVLGGSLPMLRGGEIPFINETTPTSVIPSPSSTPTETPVPESLDELFRPFWEAWDFVHEDFVDQPVDDLELMRGAIEGMLEALGDEHTSYMNPDEYMQANSRLEGEYEGIGAWVDPNAEYLTIIDPMPGSPAEEVGLLPGDEIIAIDGEDMTGIDGNLVIRRVLGPAGTKVHLTIRREGEPDPLEFDIIRAHIIIPSVESEMLEEEIGYIHLFDFGEQTTQDLRDAIQEIRKEKPLGLILDLRGNPGGLLNTAIEVASEFIPEGTVMIERFGDGEEQVYEANEGGIATEIPLVVLINGGSASASEIVAGAVQDSGRGILVGETSFGKGSVQTWHPLSDEGAVRVTIARWYTPNGRQIHSTGLTPDVEILIDPETLEEGEDPQLDKAIEILLEGN